MDEAEIRRALAPYTFDGTEAMRAIGTLLCSPHRPPDHELAGAISKILRRCYADTVTVDAVINLVATKHVDEPDRPEGYCEGCVHPSIPDRSCFRLPIPDLVRGTSSSCVSAAASAQFGTRRAE
jgi:hypothetical protein